MDVMLAQGPPDAAARESMVFDPLVGLVSFVGENECGPTDPAVFVCAAQSSNLAVLGLSEGEYRITGSGAGLTRADAFWAAAGEVVERYCAAVVPEAPCVVGSFNDLRRHGLQAVAPERWALFDPSQYPALGLPPFLPETRLAWVPTRRLLDGSGPVFVPACLAYLSADARPFRVDGASIIGPATSTGIACAESASVASLKGLCEVIERDAFSIRWRGRLPCRRVEIDPGSPVHALYRDVFHRPGLEYMIFETTLDLPFHSFLGILRDTRHRPARYLVGGACHPDPAVAVTKTLLENAQGFQWANHVRNRAVALDDGFASINTFESRMELYVFGDQGHAFDFLLDGTTSCRLSDLRSHEEADPAQTLRVAVESMHRAGLEPLILDMTTVDAEACGLSVVKVVVPQCEGIEGDHSMRFLGGRRWREVPARLGLAGRDLTLEDVNPQPHPYP